MLCLATMIAASVAFAQAPQGGQPKGQHRQMNSLLRQAIVEKLNLTADQKAKLDQAWTDFKTANPTWMDDMKKAFENKDRAAIQKLQGIRKAAVDSWATCLTTDQKAILDTAHQQHQGQGGPGARKGHNGGQQAPPQQ